MKSWFIPGNVPSSKNSRQWTGKYFIASKSTQKYRKDTEQFWKLYKDEFVEHLESLSKPYLIFFEFVRGTKHKFDYINPLQTIQDEMVNHGWLSDDNADEIIPGIVPYSYSKDQPGVRIHLLEKDEQG